MKQTLPTLKKTLFERAFAGRVYIEPTRSNPNSLCLSCGELALVKCKTEAGLREVYISGLCEECFDNLLND